ncbi:MAG TPA: 3-deoxy-manno-octulosonate cytidylyltransferase [bacterium]|nr:3-deoxy-manno-octulosonate cytidylyltransferase [bacterium]HEX67779.1 3-deoxy-manno-octulosonate cytidylyltransferase [bacterium]
MEVYCFIPARFRSTRLPGKPLIPVRGKPLIQWVYENALKISVFKEIWIATDDERIIKTVKKFGGKALITSPSHTSGTERIKEACGILGLKNEDIIVNLQGDEPVVDGESVKKLVKVFMEDPGLKMGTLAYPSSSQSEFYDPNVVKVITDKNGFALYFSRSPIPYPREGKIEFLKHLGVYIFRWELLKKWDLLKQSPWEEKEKLEQLRPLYNSIPIRVVIAFKDSIGVDTKEDLEKLEKYLNENA